MRRCPYCNNEIAFVREDCDQCLSCGEWVTKKEAIHDGIWQITFMWEEQALWFKWVAGVVVALVGMYTLKQVADMILRYPEWTFALWLGTPGVIAIISGSGFVRRVSIHTLNRVRYASMLVVVLLDFLVLGYLAYSPEEVKVWMDSTIGFILHLLSLPSLALVPYFTWRFSTRMLETSDDFVSGFVPRKNHNVKPQ